MIDGFPKIPLAGYINSTTSFRAIYFLDLEPDVLGISSHPNLQGEFDGDMIISTN